MPRKGKRATVIGLYVHMSENFAKTLEHIGFGNREDGSGSRRRKREGNILR
jgi:hypothetical protein